MPSLDRLLDMVNSLNLANIMGDIAPYLGFILMHSPLGPVRRPFPSLPAQPDWEVLQCLVFQF